MPTIIDYPQVLATLEGQGLVCNYHNSGAFGFPRETSTHIAAFIGPEDATIRPAAMGFIRHITAPYEAHLASHARRFWEECIGQTVWLMPISHWAYELDFGSASWLPSALQSIGIDPQRLHPRNNGSAIAFSAGEGPALRAILISLLTHVAASDFTLAFPENGQIVCTVHHHKQMWWVCRDGSYVEQLDGLAMQMSILNRPPAP